MMVNRLLVVFQAQEAEAYLPILSWYLHSIPFQSFLKRSLKSFGGLSALPLSLRVANLL